MSEWDSTPYDIDDVTNEAEERAELFRWVTGDQSITLGVSEVNYFEYEIWLERDDHKAKYFDSFDDVVYYIKDEYPDADWEK